MAKLDYLAFILLSLFIIFSFFVTFYEPHNFKNVNISTESKEIVDKFNLGDPNAVERSILNWHGHILSNANTGRKDNKILEDQYSEITELTGLSSMEYGDYKNYLPTNTNKANESLYMSLYHIIKADALIQNYKVQNCVNSSLDTMKKYNKFFFFLKKEDNDRAIYLKGKSDYFNNFIRYLDSRPPDNIDRIIQDTTRLWNEKNEFRIYELECDKFKQTIEEDYNYQRSLFKFKISIASIFLFITFFAGKFVTIEKLKTILLLMISGLSYFGSGIGAICYPKNVEKETVENILKVASVTTTMATIGGLTLPVLGIRHWVFIATSIMCVISLLLSILLGISSINSDSAKQRKYSYILFSLGLFLFILFISEIVILIGLLSISISIIQSVAFFLTNSTTIS